VLINGMLICDKGHFTLWPKVERPSISTNLVARNQEFSLSTLHTKGESPKPKAVTMFNAYMAILFDKGNELSKEVWVEHEWKPKLWLRGHQFFFRRKKIKLTRSWPLDWRGCFGQGMKWDAPSSFGLWTLGLAFRSFKLWPSKSRAHGSS
jgi:hypothetical protein